MGYRSAKRRGTGAERNSRACLAAALALVALVFCACGGGSPKAPVTSEPLPPRSIDLTGLNEVQAGIAQLEALMSYHAKVVSDTAGGDRISGDFDFLAPDRYHLRIEGGIPVEVITIGHDPYVKTAGKWQRADPTYLPLSAQDLMAELEDLAAGGDWTAAAGGASSCRVYAHAGDQVCIVPDGPLQWVAFHDGATSVRIDFSDFDGRIEIKAPI